MGKLTMCRICLVENVRMYLVGNEKLQELYEKLTDIPFVTEDSRPMLACFFCYAKLKQCWQLLRKCLEAEEVFAQMLKGDYEKNSTKRGQLECFGGFTKTLIEHISVVDVCQIESDVIKEELPVVCEIPDDIEIKEEHQSEELDLDNLDNNSPGEKDIPPHHSDSEDIPTHQSDSEDIPAHQSDSEDIPAHQSDSEDIPAHQSDSGHIPPQHSDSEDEKTSKNHVRIHSGEKRFKCEICERSFTRIDTLKKHVLRIHTGEKPFKCDICQHSFTLLENLKLHIRLHTGERLYKCDVCQRSFIQKSNLRNHIRVHTGEKPYKCDICQHRFIQKGNLIKHIRVHTGEKPYKCDICQRGFTVKSCLNNHIRRHT